MALTKIIYFDKETINNILQERNKGSKTTQMDISSSMAANADTSIEASSKVKIEVPFLARLSFLFTGKIALVYALSKDKTTTITSTEISDFERIKREFKEFKGVQVYDIENSSTSLRVAGGYMRMMKGVAADVDVKEFKAVMDSYEGYDTYKLNSKTYIRFNNAAFISNYRRNDLLNTTLTVYCIPVGEFEEERFDFMKQIEEMQTLFSFEGTSNGTLSDIFPINEAEDSALLETHTDNETETSCMIKLYDAVYACIGAERVE